AGVTRPGGPPDDLILSGGGTLSWGLKSVLAGASAQVAAVMVGGQFDVDQDVRRADLAVLGPRAYGQGRGAPISSADALAALRCQDFPPQEPGRCSPVRPWRAWPRPAATSRPLRGAGGFHGAAPPA